MDCYDTKAPPGSIKCYLTLWGVGCVHFMLFQHFKNVLSNVITVTRGWGTVKIPEKRVT